MDGKLRAPLDFAIVLSWQSLVQPLFSAELGGDLLQLVHLSNSFQRGANAPTGGVNEDVFKAGQNVSVAAHVVKLEESTSGLLIAIEASLRDNDLDDDNELCVVTSQFLFRGHNALQACQSRFSVDQHSRTMTVKKTKSVFSFSLLPTPKRLLIKPTLRYSSPRNG